MSDSRRQAEIEILKYLLAHRNARDTVEGIEKWWLPRSHRYGLADITTALHNLEKHNLIHVWKSASTEPIYGRGCADDGKLQEYLRSLE